MRDSLEPVSSQQFRPVSFAHLYSRPDLVEDSQWEKSFRMVSTNGIGRESKSIGLDVTLVF